MLRTVYSYHFPETAAVVDALWASRPRNWYERAWEHDDRRDLAMLDRWRSWSGVPLDGFDHRYVTHGASEAIKDLTVNVPRVHVFAGDYEGYAAFAEARDIPIQVHRRDVTAALAPHGDDDVWWISDPSSIDGDHWPALPQFLDALGRCWPRVRVFVDMIYIGCVRELSPISPSRHPNVAAVVFSLSKPFGVYRHRIGGVYSRQPIRSLEGNRWFNNIFSVELADALMARYAVTEIPRRYAVIQARIVDALRGAGALPAEAVPCNVLLLARSPTGDPAFARVAGEHYRYCLTPELDAAVRGGR
jgi:hypothetical protein